MNDTPDRIDLRVGQERSVTLRGLGTAGYMWQERVHGPGDVVEVSWSRGFARGTEPAAAGVSAPETATIRALSPGQVTLLLVQVRPWQPDAAPNQQHRMTVTVH